MKRRALKPNLPLGWVPPAMLALLATVGSPGRAPAQDAPPTLVETQPLRLEDFSEQVRLVGRTYAWSESRITAEVSGRVAGIEADEGVYVAAGAALVKLDDERIRLILASKEAEVRQAEVSAQLAQTQLARVEELHDRHLSSQTARDSAAAWAAIQQERHRQLSAERDRLALDLERCTIRAPFAGYTGRRLVDVGEWVDAGTGVFELTDISRIRVRVDLPERYYGQLSIGNAARVERQGTEAPPLEARVVGLSARAAEETHTFPVTVSVANPDEILAGGMVVRAVLDLDKQLECLSASKDAIVRQGGQTMVYTVVEGKATPLPVTVVAESGPRVGIRGEGLAEGLPVVIRGNERVFPGSPVTVAESVSERAAGKQP